MSLSGSSCEKPDSKGLSPLSRPVLQTGSCELFERFMPKARHPDAGHHRTLLNNKLSSRKRASGRGPSRDLFGARHPAPAGRRSGLAAGLVPVGDPGRRHGAQPPSPPPRRPRILPNAHLLTAVSFDKSRVGHTSNDIARSGFSVYVTAGRSSTPELPAGCIARHNGAKQFQEAAMAATSNDDPGTWRPCR